VTIINTGIGWHEARIREFMVYIMSSRDCTMYRVFHSVMLF